MRNKFIATLFWIIIISILVIYPMLPTNTVKANENNYQLEKRFFLPSFITQTFPKDVSIIRSRVSKINTSLLINEYGKPYNTKFIKLNLFGNVVYRGIIIKIEKTEFGYVWTGILDGIPYSYFTIMKVGKLFIGNIGSPQGVYEFSNIGGSLYRIIKINPTPPTD